MSDEVSDLIYLTNIKGDPCAVRPEFIISLDTNDEGFTDHGYTVLTLFARNGGFLTLKVRETVNQIKDMIDWAKKPKVEEKEEKDNSDIIQLTNYDKQQRPLFLKAYDIVRFFDSPFYPGKYTIVHTVSIDNYREGYQVKETPEQIQALIDKTDTRPYTVTFTKEYKVLIPRVPSDSGERKSYIEKHIKESSLSDVHSTGKYYILKSHPSN